MITNDVPFPRDLSYEKKKDGKTSFVVLTIMNAVVAMLPLVLGSLIGMLSRSSPPIRSDVVGDKHLPYQYRQSLQPERMGRLSGLYHSLHSNSNEKSVNSSQEWYDSLRKPFYTPPPAAFAIAWPILYSLLGLAVFCAAFGATWKQTLLLYAFLTANMAFNLMFPVVQFVWRDLFVAMVITWFTFITSLALLLSFVLVSNCGSIIAAAPWWTSKLRDVAPWLLLPYILWLLFASVMASDFYAMNRKDQDQD